MFVGSPALPFPGLIVIGFYNEKQAAMVPIAVPIGDFKSKMAAADFFRENH